MTGGGLMGLIKIGVEGMLKEKEPFDLDHTSLHLYIYMMNESGLGVIDEYVDYCIDQLEKLDITTLKSIDKHGETLLHCLCINSGRVSHKFSHRLFEYLVSRGLKTDIANNDGHTCINLLSKWNWDY